MNLYGYVGNGVVTRVDEFGLKFKFMCDSGRQLVEELAGSDPRLGYLVKWLEDRSEVITVHLVNNPESEYGGNWHNSGELVINVGTNFYMRSAAHELQHAMDDLSGWKGVIRSSDWYNINKKVSESEQRAVRTGNIVPNSCPNAGPPSSKYRGFKVDNPSAAFSPLDGKEYVGPIFSPLR